MTSRDRRGADPFAHDRAREGDQHEAANHRAPAQRVAGRGDRPGGAERRDNGEPGQRKDRRASERPHPTSRRAPRPRAPRPPTATANATWPLWKGPAVRDEGGRGGKRERREQRHPRRGGQRLPSARAPSPERPYLTFQRYLAGFEASLWEVL